MFYIISKIANVFLNPLIMFLILAFFSLFFTKKSKKWLYFSFFILYFFSIPFFLNFTAKIYMSGTGNFDHQKIYDYGIVLGGMAKLNPKDNKIDFSEDISRLLSAVELFNQKKIKKIFISGGGLGAEREALFLKNYLVLTGIPERSIEIEYKSLNTFQNAVYTAYILKPECEKKNYLLITSDYHIPRAYRCFKKAGFKIDNYPSGQLQTIPGFHLKQFIPNVEVLVGWQYLFHEFVGIIAYRLAGYI